MLKRKETGMGERRKKGNCVGVEVLTEILLIVRSLKIYMHRVLDWFFMPISYIMSNYFEDNA